MLSTGIILLVGVVLAIQLSEGITTSTPPPSTPPQPGNPSAGGHDPSAVVRDPPTLFIGPGALPDMIPKVGGDAGPPTVNDPAGNAVLDAQVPGTDVAGPPVDPSGTGVDPSPVSGSLGGPPVDVPDAGVADPPVVPSGAIGTGDTVGTVKAPDMPKPAVFPGRMLLIREPDPAVISAPAPPPADNVGTGNAGMTVTNVVGAIGSSEDDPSIIYNECLRANCLGACYLPHPTNCFKFIMCQPLESGSLRSQVMPCAFGTKWKSGPEPACDRYDLVDCINDPCRNNQKLKIYDHPDNNCRTFWRCVQGRSHPGCCPQYQRFDPFSGTCINDETCVDACPLMNDATCAGGGLRYADVPDGNCKTYWDCQAENQHPLCCPDGQGFDVFDSVCKPNPNCLDTCPPEYQDSCTRAGLTAYDLVDNNCRTYMKCNEKRMADPYCCQPNMEYNSALRQCVDSVTCTDGCPYGYKEDCRLEAVPGLPTHFKNLDFYGGTPMQCPIGTLFDPSSCSCRLDKGSQLRKAPPPGCNFAIHAIPPSLQNKGTAVAALLMIGDYGQGERGVGNMSAFWDGGDGLNIPYYGSQTFWNFYLQIQFQPTRASAVKQILLSSCEYINDQPNLPSLEVSLDSFTNNGGTLNVKAASSEGSLFQAQAPYKLNDNLDLQLIYDSSKLGMRLNYNDNARQTYSSVQPFSGQVPIDRSGLRFAHCRYEKGIASFIGYVSDIKFAKCVPDAIANTLNNANVVAPA